MPFKIKKISKSNKKNTKSFFSLFRSSKKQAKSKTDTKEKPVSKKDKLKTLFLTQSKSSRIISMFLALVFICFGVFFVYKVIFSVYSFIADFELTTFLTFSGTELKKDSSGYTNILLLGSGGREHESPDLTDTIILASLDESNKIVSMISIPRDTHVKHFGSLKINEVYRNTKVRMMNKLNKNETEASKEAIKTLQDYVKKITNFEPQYFIKVDFKAIKKVVDAVGGIDIMIDETINDPYYPTKKWGYQKFYLKKGFKHLDGETTLKYVRSRKTTSDFSRSKRQQKIIFGLKEAALKNEILTSPSAIKKLFNAISENIETNISMREILTFAKIAISFEKENLVSRVLNDDPSQVGGFLYTPEREFYNGAFVLLPWGNNYDKIHEFTYLLNNHREAFIENASIEIQNGTKTAGMASQVYTYLNRLGLNIINITNTYNKTYYDKTVIINYSENTSSTLEALKSIIPGVYIKDIKYYTEQYKEQKTGSGIEQDEDYWFREKMEILQHKKEGVDIIIILGNDFDNEHVRFY